MPINFGGVGLREVIALKILNFNPSIIISSTIIYGVTVSGSVSLIGILYINLKKSNIVTFLRTFLEIYFTDNSSFVFNSFKRDSLSFLVIKDWFSSISEILANLDWGTYLSLILFRNLYL